MEEHASWSRDAVRGPVVPLAEPPSPGPPSEALDLRTPSLIIAGVFALLATLSDFVASDFFPGGLGAALLLNLGIFLFGALMTQAILRLVLAGARAGVSGAVRDPLLPTPLPAEQVPSAELLLTGEPKGDGEAVEWPEAFEDQPLPGGLTPREAEILLLLAQGSTSAEVSGALFISVHTVTRHIANTYAKIGARNRAEAITWAIKSGIAPGLSGAELGGDPTEPFAELGETGR